MVTKNELIEMLRLAVDFEENDVDSHRAISIGVALFPSPGPGVQDMESLMEAADKALYEAKRRGRDKSFLPPMELFFRGSIKGKR